MSSSHAIESAVQAHAAQRLAAATVLRPGDFLDLVFWPGIHVSGTLAQISDKLLIILEHDLDDWLPSVSDSVFCPWHRIVEANRARPPLSLLFPNPYDLLPPAEKLNELAPCLAGETPIPQTSFRVGVSSQLASRLPGSLEVSIAKHLRSLGQCAVFGENDWIGNATSCVCEQPSAPSPLAEVPLVPLTAGRQAQACAAMIRHAVGDDFFKRICRARRDSFGRFVGFPDLVVVERPPRFVEVKRRGEPLRGSQAAVFSALVGAGIEVRLARCQFAAA